MEERFELNLSKRNSWLLAGLIISISLVILSFSFKNIIFYELADEGYYLGYGSFIAEKGLSGFKELFRLYIEHQQIWLYPNPLRLGFIIFSALWIKAFGCFFANLAYFSFLCFLLFLVLNFHYLKKYFGQATAVFSLILLSSSPLNLAMARRCLTEGVLILFTYLSFWLFFDILKEKSRLKKVLFVLCATMSILIKETAVLYLLFFFIFHFFHNHFAKEKLSLKDSWWIYCLPVLLAGLAYAGLGVFSYIFRIAAIILTSPQDNFFAKAFGAGPWFRYILDYLLLSPLVAIFGMAFIVSYLSEKEHAKEVIFPLTFLIFTFLIFDFFTKSVRYVMAMDLPLRLCAVLMLSRLTQRWFTKRALAILSAIILLIAVGDYLNFWHFFVKEAIYDPSSFFLLKAENLTPFK